MPVRTRQMFTPGLEAEDYRVQLARAMQQRAMTPNLPPVGGPVQAVYSPWQGLTDLATALVSSRNVRKSEDAYQRAQQAQMAAKQAAQQEALQAMIGRQVQPPVDGVGPMPEGGRVTPSYEETIAASQGAINAGVAPEIAKALLELRKPKEPQRVDLGDRIGLINDQGQVVGEIPKGATPDAAMREQGDMARWQTPSANTQMTVGATMRGQDVSAATTRRGQDMTYGAAVRGQDMTADTARRGQDLTIGRHKPLTEFQAKAISQLRRMEGAEKQLSEQEYAPTSVTGGGWNVAMSGVPVVGNAMTSGNFQQYQQSAREWISGLLRLDSGAAVPEVEFQRYFQTYFAQPGDSDEVVQQKATARVRAAEALREGLGGVAPQNQQTPVPIAPADDPIGAISNYMQQYGGR